MRVETTVLARDSFVSCLTTRKASIHPVVSLIRALVRGCKVLLLDEATSSVDPETDAVIQRIIQTEFSDVTVGISYHHLKAY